MEQLSNEFKETKSMFRLIGWTKAALLIYQETKKFLSLPRYAKNAKLFDQYLNEEKEIQKVTVSEHINDDVDSLIIDRLVEIDHKKKYKDLNAFVQNDNFSQENDEIETEEGELEIVTLHRKRWEDIVSVLKAA